MDRKLKSKNTVIQEMEKKIENSLEEDSFINPVKLIKIGSETQKCASIGCFGLGNINKGKKTHSS